LKKTIIKKLQNLFKQTGYSFYKIIYGNIKGLIYPENDIRIKEDKVKVSDNVSYRVFTVRQGRIYTDTVNNQAVILDNKLVYGPSFQLRNTKNAKIQDNIVFENGTPRIKKKLKGIVFSLLTGGAGNENYWHWLFDVLPRLEILNRRKDIRDIDYFLFPGLKQRFQTETLNMLNIPLNKRLSSRQYRHFEADEIIVVDHPYVLKNDPSIEIQNLPKWIIEWLKSTFLKNIKFDQEYFPKKIYLDRSDTKSNFSHTRKITNEDEVKETLIKNGFSIILLANLTFKEQISLFKNATHIVGLHGAGFANLVFCGPETLVIELKPSTAGFVIKNLAEKNNLIYKDISVIPHEHANNNQQGFIKIPLYLLEKIIQN